MPFQYKWKPRWGFPFFLLYCDMTLHPTFAEVAAILGLTVNGEDRRIGTLSDPLLSRPDDLIVLTDKRLLPKKAQIQAGSWIVDESLLTPNLEAFMIDRKISYAPSASSTKDFIKLMTLFFPEISHDRIHPTALIGDSTILGEGVFIGPYAVIGDFCEIGPHAQIHAHCTIGNHVTVGANVRLYAGVNVYDRTFLGHRVTIHSGTVIGSDGFGFLHSKDGHQKIPHAGRVVIEDDVEIGSNCSVDRGTLGETRIGKGTKIDNLVQIAHNVHIGQHGLIAAQTGIAGSTIIGEWVTIAGQVGIVGHITIGDHVTIGAQAGVIGSIADRKTVSGYPAREHQQALRREGHIDKIPDLIERIQNLEKPR